MEADERSVTSESSVEPDLTEDALVSTSTPRKDSVSTIGESDVENMALVLPENNWPNMVVPDTKRYTHTQKTGDVAMEQHVFDRMEALGLLENKKQLEKQLSEKLEKEMAKGDHIVGAISRSRRQREVRDRVLSVKNEIQNTIRTRVHEDESGVKFYKVQLLMGRFTRDVRHSVDGQEVFICGTTPNGSCLVKETQIEFPETVDMSRMQTSFKAGVFRMDVPFKSQSSMGSVTSSSCDEAAMLSGISDTCSNEDPFSSDPEMETNSQDGKTNSPIRMLHVSR